MDDEDETHTCNESRSKEIRLRVERNKGRYFIRVFIGKEREKRWTRVTHVTRGSGVVFFKDSHTDLLLKGKGPKKKGTEETEII